MGTDIHLRAEIMRDGQWQRLAVAIPNDRNYWSFAVLANVRNGDLGDPIAPISQLRGIPYDTTVAIEELGEHSYSWLMLRELLDYNPDRQCVLRGMVDKATAEHFRTTGIAPSLYYAWTNQADYEQIEWYVPLRKAAWLLTKIITTLTPLGDPNAIRLVFGFDS